MGLAFIWKSASICLASAISVNPNKPQADRFQVSHFASCGIRCSLAPYARDGTDGM
jgi:hypothetical protein